MAMRTMTCLVTVSPDTDAEISAREIGSIYSATSFLRPATLSTNVSSDTRRELAIGKWKRCRSDDDATQRDQSEWPKSIGI